MQNRQKQHVYTWMGNAHVAHVWLGCIKRFKPKDDTRRLLNWLPTFPNNYFCLSGAHILHLYSIFCCRHTHVWKNMCSKQSGRSWERRHPPLQTLLHDWNPASFAPSFNLWSWWLLKSGIEHLLRREKWVGGGCVEQRGGGVLDLSVSASRGTGLQPWLDLLLRASISLFSAQYCSCTDLLLHFKSFSESQFPQRAILSRVLLLFRGVDLVPHSSGTFSYLITAF